MSTRSRRVLPALLLTIAAMSSAFGVTVHATNGYFLLGIGTLSKGMGGTGVALGTGPASPATNPAGIALGSPGIDVGVGLFTPNRDYEVTGNPSGYPGTFGLAPGKVSSDSPLFPVPHAGWSRPSGRAAFGLLLYANGGMNTNYNAKTFGVAPTGVNLSQMFVAPTVAFKVADGHAIGVSPILAYQMFKAEGLAAFSAFSSSSSNLTNRDTANALGGGVRVGYMGRWTEQFSIGAAYQSRIVMSKLDNYRGLFAEAGSFDIPSNVTVGVAFHPTSELDLAFDVQRMNYSEVKSVANPLLPNLMTAQLGAAGGAGFGWKDMTVVKGGVEWRPSRDWAARAGYAYGQQPIGESEVLFNILAPGVIEQHVTAGVSRTTGRHTIDVSVIRALSHSVTGANPLEAPNQQRITLRMDQWDVAVGYRIVFK